MHIYWRSREKKRAPPSAQFCCLSFLADQPICFKAPSIQVETLPPPSWHLKIKHRLSLPNREEWIQNVDKALSQKIEKVVLARCQILELVDEPDPWAIAAALESRSEGAFIFCLQEGDKAFVGASPERLFARKNKALFIEAMAGTRKKDVEAQEFLAGEKEMRELLPVQRFLKDRLAPICLSPPLFSPVAIYPTQNVQHLYSSATAQLKEGISDAMILKAIHPTPALCGAPQKEALDLIGRLEPFERGLYGGAIGWSTPDASEWAVGIRSCFIEKKTVYLFSGAGIVSGSDGAAEWDELNHKTKLFEGIFV
jgi:menaquinone-specific isochorismate synthase